jgi:DNA-binding transcriptional MerR regulator
VDKHGQTVSATDFAEVTGISRERLRTWERRFGFPQPVRSGQGPRRYALTDAPRVLAVRRAAEQGVPLANAISAVAAGEADGADWAGGEPVSAATLAAIATAAPTPVVLVTGPQPLRVAWINTPLGALPAAPAVGEELDALPWFLGSDLERTLHTLFAGDTAVLECGHPAWDGSAAHERSVAYRLPPQPGEPPAVALVGADRTDEQRARRELGELRRELTSARGRERRLERWIELTASLAERFQREADDAVLGVVTSTMVRALRAVDAGIAVYMAGELALGSSSRGVLGPRMVTVTGYDDLAGLMHAGRPGWLAPATGAAFGTPLGLQTLAVPIVVVGDTLGLLLLVFDERTELDEDARRLLSVVSAGLGFTLLRDRLVASGRG